MSEALFPYQDLRERALFPYQEEAARRMAAAKKMACLLEPGLGKTAITLHALALLDRPRALVVAPARVAETVWHREAALWPELGLEVVPAVGTSIHRARVIVGDADIVVLSYENLPWLLSLFDVGKYFRAIVFDELSKMKHAGSTRFRRLRSQLGKFDVRFGLTGTPVGNHLMDIWGEMYCIGEDKPLGPSFVEFQHRLFTPVAWNQFTVTKWVPIPTAQRQIEAAIKPWAFTLRPSEAPALAELRLHLLPVALPAEVEQASADLAENLQVKLASGDNLAAFSATIAAMKIRQMAGGAVYLDPPLVLGEPTGSKKWVHVHGEKLQAVEELVAELQGEPLLVFYWFRHERERLLAHFTGTAVDISEPDSIDRWNRREVEILLAHPASAGHGLNLQQGGHNICWFTLPWSLELWKQAHGRLIRHGQASPFVNSHVLMSGKADEVVLGAIHRKRGVEEELLEAMLR